LTFPIHSLRFNLASQNEGRTPHIALRLYSCIAVEESVEGRNACPDATAAET
jgi:hypothetical protein